MLRSLRASSLLLLVLLAVRSPSAAEPADFVGYWEGTIKLVQEGQPKPLIDTFALLEVTEEGGRFGGILGFHGHLVDLKAIVPRPEGGFGFTFTDPVDPKGVMAARIMGNGTLELFAEDEVEKQSFRVVLNRVAAPESPVELPTGLFTGILAPGHGVPDDMRVALAIKKGESGPEIALSAFKESNRAEREVTVTDIKAEIRGPRVTFTIERHGITSRFYGDVSNSGFRLCGQIPNFGLGGSGVLSRSVQQ